MSKKVYCIATDKGPVSVDGVSLPGPFAIHPSGSSDPDAKYVLDHVPTGAAICHVGTQAKARRVAKILLGLLDWSREDYASIRDEIKERFPYLLVDLAIDGLIFAPDDWLNDKVAELHAKDWKHTCYQTTH